MYARRTIGLLLAVMMIVAGTAIPAASSGGERLSRVDAVEAPATATLESTNGGRVTEALLEPLAFQ